MAEPQSGRVDISAPLRGSAGVVRYFTWGCGRALGIDPDSGYIGVLRDRYSFKSATNRNPGDVDLSSHYRKGVKGDWLNFFDWELAEAFDARFGDICDRLGYDRVAVVLDCVRLGRG